MKLSILLLVQLKVVLALTHSLEYRKTYKKCVYCCLEYARKDIISFAIQLFERRSIYVQCTLPNDLYIIYKYSKERSLYLVIISINNLSGYAVKTTISRIAGHVFNCYLGKIFDLDLLGIRKMALTANLQKTAEIMAHATLMYGLSHTSRMRKSYMKLLYVIILYCL